MRTFDLRDDKVACCWSVRREGTTLVPRSGKAGIPVRAESQEGQPYDDQRIFYCGDTE